MARPDANRDLVPGLRVIHVFVRDGAALRVVRFNEKVNLESKTVAGDWMTTSPYSLASTLLEELADVAGRLNFDGTGED